MWYRPWQYFNPRSLTGATIINYSEHIVTFISIHAPSRERPSLSGNLQRHLAISIHAPLRERPVASAPGTATPLHFNPRSLAGATASATVYGIQLLLFQSTLPHGSDATLAFLFHIAAISIHAPSRERQMLPRSPYPFAGISIHAPSRERLRWCNSSPTHQ